MGQQKMTHLLYGYVVVELSGANVNALINEAQSAGILVWDIYWQKNGHAVCSLYARDVFRFRKVARTAGIRFRIIQKRGVPFFLFRVERRKFFALGLCLFIVILLLASNVVWHIDVEGNETIPEKEILHHAKNAGVYVGQFQFRLEDNDAIQRQLTLQLKRDVSWIGFHLEGTRAVITVVEKRKVDEKEQKDLSGPYDLVARRSGTIADLSGVETGRIVVDYNDTVKKGDLLVSGIYRDFNQDEEDETAPPPEVVGARGVVIGETWYETTVSVPLVHMRKMYTGERDISHYPFIGHWSLSIPLLNRPPFTEYETILQAKTVYLWKWRLPFGLVEEERLEMNRMKVKRTEEEAERLALERAQQDVLGRLGAHGEIKSYKILQKRVKGGKVLLKILFTVRENIAEPKPIFLEKSEDDT